MKVEDLIVLGKKSVHSDFAKMLLADLLNMNALQLYTCLDMEVSSDIIEIYQKKLELLKQDKPIQYVLGNVNFYGLTLFVNEDVLIPRFETEELVDYTIKFIQKRLSHIETLRMIDLGCGSGAIGLTLKSKFPSADVTLLDISEKALAVAKKNAENLNLEVHFVQGDMLENVDGCYHVIISNPPYIQKEEEIDPLVLQNEPSLALFGGIDGLDYYRKILKRCSNHLEKDFLIAFEIGYQQKEAITTLVYDNLSNVQVICLQDLSGRDRMLFVFPNEQ